VNAAPDCEKDGSHWRSGDGCDDVARLAGPSRSALHDRDRDLDLGRLWMLSMLINSDPTLAAFTTVAAGLSGIPCRPACAGVGV